MGHALPVVAQCVLAIWLVGMSLPARAQQTSLTAQPHVVSGRVLNVRTLSPVPRALVMLNERAVLTDALGRFSFPEFSGKQASIMATKPGYSQGPDPLDGLSQRVISDFASPVELRLYADAVIAGTVKSRDGGLLANVPVTLLRAVYDISGAHATQSGFAMTNSRGEYRFLQPAGEYRVQTQFVALRPDTGKQLLPASFPQETSSHHASFLSVRDGAEIQLDLSPASGTPNPILFQIEPKAVAQALRTSVTTQSGDSFAVPLQSTETPGEFRLELMPGAYALQFHAMQAEQSFDGSTQLRVTSESSPPLQLPRVQVSLSPTSALPIEIRIDEAQRSIATSSTGSPSPEQLPTPSSLNLTLQDLSPPAAFDAPAPVPFRQDRTYLFRVSPGRYRLRTQDSGAWHVTAATYGPSNVLEDEIVVGSSNSGEPVRIMVGNRSGQVSGTVDISQSQAPAWVYLFPRAQSLTPFYEVHTSPQGTWRRSLPPGAYTVLAVPHRALLDLTDVVVRSRFASNGRQIEIVDAVNSTVDLPLLQPAEEVP